MIQVEVDGFSLAIFSILPRFFKPGYGENLEILKNWVITYDSEKS